MTDDVLATFCSGSVPVDWAFPAGDAFAGAFEGAFAGAVDGPLEGLAALWPVRAEEVRAEARADREGLAEAVLRATAAPGLATNTRPATTAAPADAAANSR